MENDLISRKALLDTLQNHFGQDLAYLGEDLQYCQEAVQFAPAVEAEPKWISVKDGLPEKNGYYLCWVEASSVGKQKRCEHRKLYWEENVWLLSAKVFFVEHPLYWMPLPEPPKEGRPTKKTCPATGLDCIECVPGYLCAKMDGGAE